MTALSPHVRELLKKAQNHQPFPLSALEAISAIRRHLNELEFAAVASAREKGATWREIAQVLGVSRQAAQNRFGRAGDQ